MTLTEKYLKFYAACKSLKLTNADIAILLNVTPTMVSRYQKDAERIGTRGDKEKLPRAAKALKYLNSTFGKKELVEMAPLERSQSCLKAIREVDPTLNPRAQIFR